MIRMRRIKADQHRWLKLALLLLGGVCFVAAFKLPTSHTQSGADNCLKCHAQAAGRAAEVVQLHKASTHGQHSVSCQDCHGGDVAQTDKSKAHAGAFVARPDANATLQMCGACHQTQLAQFKTSRHFPEQRGIPRLDCAECHGAHSIGNPPEAFTFAQFCVGCHGLEYLPALPPPFQDLMALTDEVRDELRRLPSGRKLSAEAREQRAQLRRLTAELVHATDRGGGLVRIPELLPLGAKLKQQIKTENR